MSHRIEWVPSWNLPQLLTFLIVRYNKIIAFPLYFWSSYRALDKWNKIWDAVLEKPKTCDIDFRTLCQADIERAARRLLAESW